jgi:hypothetical protein
VEEPEPAIAEPNLVTVPDRDIREFRSGSCAQIDPSSRAFRQFAMSRHEVGMEVSLDDIFDLTVLAGRGLEVDIDIALGVDYSCDALGGDHVRRMGQAAQKESLYVYRFHRYLLDDGRFRGFYCGWATRRR